MKSRASDLQETDDVRRRTDGGKGLSLYRARKRVNGKQDADNEKNEVCEAAEQIHKPTEPAQVDFGVWEAAVEQTLAVADAHGRRPQDVILEDVLTCCDPPLAPLGSTTRQKLQRLLQERRLFDQDGLLQGNWNSTVSPF